MIITVPECRSSVTYIWPTTLHFYSPNVNSTYGLTNKWASPIRPHPVGTNQCKYRALDRALRSGEENRLW